MKGKELKRLAVILAVCAAVAAAIKVTAGFFITPLVIRGSSMSPTVCEGDVVLVRRSPDFTMGDVVAFYSGDGILVKRVIAGPGSWVFINSEGDVYVDGNAVDEPQITDKSAGESEIDYPYAVPGESYFVLGDHRSVSVDSRSGTVGCISGDSIIGRVYYRVLPLSAWGTIK